MIFKVYPISLKRVFNLNTLERPKLICDKYSMSQTVSGASKKYRLSTILFFVPNVFPINFRSCGFEIVNFPFNSSSLAYAEVSNNKF